MRRAKKLFNSPKPAARCGARLKKTKNTGKSVWDEFIRVATQFHRLSEKFFYFFGNCGLFTGISQCPLSVTGKTRRTLRRIFAKGYAPNKNTFTSALSNPFIRSRRSASTVRSSLERRLFADYFLLQRFSLLNYCYYKHSLRSLSTV